MNKVITHYFPIFAFIFLSSISIPIGLPSSKIIRVITIPCIIKTTHLCSKRSHFIYRPIITYEEWTGIGRLINAGMSMSIAAKISRPAVRKTALGLIDA